MKRQYFADFVSKRQSPVHSQVFQWQCFHNFAPFSVFMAHHLAPNSRGIERYREKNNLSILLLFYLSVSLCLFCLYVCLYLSASFVRNSLFLLFCALLEEYCLLQKKKNILICMKKRLITAISSDTCSVKSNTILCTYPLIIVNQCSQRQQISVEM